MSDAVKKTALAPKLRFPGFSEGWKKSLVADVCELRAGTFVAAEKIKQVHEGESYPCYGGNGLRGFVSTFTHEGTFPLIGRQGALCGNVTSASSRFYATEHALVATPREEVSVDWLTYALVRMNLNQFATGQAQPGLSVDVLDALTMPYPTSVAEQRKIADCLQSLDELIAAQAEKLEALKRHKKGLLQQLFPAEGETIPRLRFPQFLNAGEWNYRTIEELAENLDNRRVPISSSQRVRGETPYYGASGVVDYVEGYIFDETLLCVSEDGANLVARTTPIAFTVEGRTWVNNHAHVLKFADLHIHWLVEAYMNEMDLRDFLTGMAQPKLNRGMLDNIAIPLPPSREETSLVAGILSTVDRSLAESEKLLREFASHKAALMQQLFPSLDEF